MYQVRGEPILRQIEARQHVWDDWLALAEALSEDPRNPSICDPIRDVDARAGTYTAPFDAAVLMYQVMADYPLVELLQVTWLSDFLAAEFRSPDTE